MTMRFLLLLFTILLVCFLSIEAQQVEDLEALSDKELETICTSLGFALVDTDESGAKLALTHADYVEAARQCLEVQDQMEEILAENPELMDEYIEERDRMIAAEKAENERLLAEKDRLEAELASAAATGGSTSSVSGAFGVGKKQTTPEPLIKEEKLVANASASVKDPVVESETETADDDASTDPVVDDDDDLVNQVLEESISSSSPSNLKLPQAVTDVIDKVLPKPMQVMIGKVLIRIRDDGWQLLKFLKRQGLALIGQILKKVEEAKAAKAAAAANASARAAQ